MHILLYGTLFCNGKWVRIVARKGVDRQEVYGTIVGSVQWQVAHLGFAKHFTVVMVHLRAENVRMSIEAFCRCEYEDETWDWKTFVETVF